MQHPRLSLRSVLDALDIEQTDLALLEERIDIITHKLKFITPENRPRVLLLNDTTPLPADAEGYLGELVQLAGGIHHTSDTPDTAPQPDVLIIINDKPMPQLLAELPSLLVAPRWAEMPAVMNNRIYIVYHPDHLRRPGTQIADDAELLAEILHPKQFIFGRDEDAWMKFDWQ